MSLTPTLSLFKDSNYSPTYWWLEVTIDSSSYVVDTHESPVGPNAVEELHIDVNLAEPGDGASTITVDIGQSSLHQTTGQVHVKLLDASQGEKGNGNVSTVSAQEATKPIPSPSL